MVDSGKSEHSNERHQHRPTQSTTKKVIENDFGDVSGWHSVDFLTSSQAKNETDAGSNRQHCKGALLDLIGHFLDRVTTEARRLAASRKHRKIRGWLLH
jgi:hypothetical protein